MVTLPPLPVKIMAWPVANPASAKSVPPPRLNVPPLAWMLGTCKTPPLRLYVPAGPSTNPPEPVAIRFVPKTVFVPPDWLNVAVPWLPTYSSAAESTPEPLRL